MQLSRVLYPNNFISIVLFVCIFFYHSKQTLPRGLLFPAAPQGSDLYWSYHAAIIQRMNQLQIVNRQLNTQQKQAVAAVVLGYYRPSPYVIFGPPGMFYFPVATLPYFCILSILCIVSIF